MINGKTNLYGIIGSPVTHSFSPTMQTKAFQSLDINSVYLPFSIEKEDIPQILNHFRAIKLKGFNATVPYKEEIIPYLDELSFQAKLTNSVNTVIFEDNRWIGHSTDGVGFIRSLEENQVQIENQHMVILGAGGAAKAIVFALAEAKVKKITILNRTISKAESLIEQLKKTFPTLEYSSESPRDSKYILINTTSLGMKEDVSPASDDLINRSKFVADIIYNPSQTNLLRKAAQQNIPSCNGLGMLLHQGAEAFEIWTRQKAPLKIMAEQLESLCKT